MQRLPEQFRIVGLRVLDAGHIDGFGRAHGGVPHLLREIAIHVGQDFVGIRLGVGHQPLERQLRLVVRIGPALDRGRDVLGRTRIAAAGQQIPGPHRFRVFRRDLADGARHVVTKGIVHHAHHGEHAIAALLEVGFECFLFLAREELLELGAIVLRNGRDGLCALPQHVDRNRPRRDRHLGRDDSGFRRPADRIVRQLLRHPGLQGFDGLGFGDGLGRRARRIHRLPQHGHLPVDLGRCHLLHVDGHGGGGFGVGEALHHLRGPGTPDQGNGRQTFRFGQQIPAPGRVLGALDQTIERLHPRLLQRRKLLRQPFDDFRADARARPLRPACRLDAGNGARPGCVLRFPLGPVPVGRAHGLRLLRAGDRIGGTLPALRRLRHSARRVRHFHRAGVLGDAALRHRRRLVLALLDELDAGLLPHRMRCGHLPIGGVLVDRDVEAAFGCVLERRASIMNHALDVLQRLPVARSIDEGDLRDHIGLAVVARVAGERDVLRSAGRKVRECAHFGLAVRAGTGGLVAAFHLVAAGTRRIRGEVDLETILGGRRGSATEPAHVLVDVGQNLRAPTGFLRVLAAALGRARPGARMRQDVFGRHPEAVGHHLDGLGTIGNGLRTELVVLEADVGDADRVLVERGRMRGALVERDLVVNPLLVEGDMVVRNVAAARQPAIGRIARHVMQHDVAHVVGRQRREPAPGREILHVDAGLRADLLPLSGRPRLRLGLKLLAPRLDDLLGGIDGANRVLGRAFLHLLQGRRCCLIAHHGLLGRGRAGNAPDLLVDGVEDLHKLGVVRLRAGDFGGEGRCGPFNIALNRRFQCKTVRLGLETPLKLLRVDVITHLQLGVRNLFPVLLHDRSNTRISLVTPCVDIRFARNTGHPLSDVTIGSLFGLQ